MNLFFWIQVVPGRFIIFTSAPDVVGDPLGDRIERSEVLVDVEDFGLFVHNLANRSRRLVVVVGYGGRPVATPAPRRRVFETPAEPIHQTGSNLFNV